MIGPKELDRINELSRLARQRPLTAAEQAERAALRRDYVAAFRASLETQLDHTSVKYPDGRVEKLKKKDETPSEK